MCAKPYSCRLVGPSIRNKYLKRNNKLKTTNKNLNWHEADQLAKCVYKHGQGVQLGCTEKQFQLVVRVGFEVSRGPFLESPDNFSGPESYFICSMFTLKTLILLILKAEQ